MGIHRLAKRLRRWLPALAVFLGFVASAAVAQTPSQVYLFCYHEGTWPNGGNSGVFLSWSSDGKHFTTLNNGKPVFTTPQFSSDNADNSSGTTNTTRDPSIIYDATAGLYRMIWTSALSTRSFGYADSPDLKTWSHVQLAQMWPKNTYATVGRTWAPEWFYDDTTGNYMIIFSSDVNGASLREYYTILRTTGGAISFDTPVELYHEPDGTSTAIDGAIAKVGPDHYMLATAQHNAIWIAESTTPYGPWTMQPSAASPTGVEAPAFIKIGGTWHLYYDHYASADNVFGLGTATDITQWTDITSQTYLPRKADIPAYSGPPHHGTVFMAPTATIGVPGIPYDSDGDGLDDSWERTNFGNLSQSGGGDPDHDGYTNEEEELAGSDPNNVSSYPGHTQGIGISTSSGGWDTPANTLDGDLGTRATATGDGASITYSLGTICQVASVDIAFYQGNSRVYKFDVQTSTDNSTWTTVLSGATSSGSSLVRQNFVLSGTPIAAYVRIVGHGYNGNTAAENSYAEVAINPVLTRAQLNFDESSGTTASDASGHGWNGTLVNGPTWVAGKNGNALSLGGGTAHATLPSGVVSGMTNFTIAAWVYVSTASSWQRVFDFGTGTATNMYLTIKNGATGTPRFGIKVSNGTEQQLTSSIALPTGAWTHLAVTLSGTTGTLYVNGVARCVNTAMTWNPSSLGSTALNYLGRSQFSADPYFNGLVDDFRILYYAMSASQIASLASGLPAPDGLAATAGNKQVALTWSATSGATGYRVRRGTTSGSNYATAFTTSSPSFTDTNVQNGTTYYYVVHALNSIGKSQASAEVSATPVPPPAPGTPIGLTATGGSASILLGWVSTPGADSYTIWRSPTTGTGFSLLVSGVTGTSYLDSGLGDAAGYYYCITASNDGGTSGESAEASATTYSAAENWRFAHFGTISNTGDAADSADPDGDGSTNQQERVAGTDPKDVGSLLRISTVQPGGSDVVVQFPTVSGKTYTVQYSDTLQSGSWSTVQTNGVPQSAISGTGSALQVTDTGGAAQPKRFYRVVVR